MKVRPIPWRRAIAKTALAALLLALPSAVAASPRLQIEPLFKPYYKVGELVPVRVTVGNDDDAGGTYRLQLEQSTGASQQIARSAHDIELPARSRKELILHTPAPVPMRRFEASLLTGRGRVVSTAKLEAEPLERGQRIVAVIGGAAVGLRSLKLDDPKIFRTRIDRPLPTEWVTWSAVDVVIWPDPEPSELTRDERAALLRWVRGGGSLIVFTPRGRSPIGGSFLESMLPVTVDDHVELAHAPGIIPTPLTRSRFRDIDGEIVFGTHDDPVVVMSRYGFGRVVACAFDARSSSFVRGTTGRNFWRPLLDRLVPPELEAEPTNSYYYGNYAAVFDQALAAMPGVSVTGIWIVAALLGLYLIAIGPVDYLLQRRFGRKPWAWLTYPAMIGIFSAAILGVSAHQRKSGSRVRTITIEDRVGGAIRGHVMTAISSEKRAIATLTAADDSVRFVNGRNQLQQNYSVTNALSEDPTLFASAGGIEFPLSAWKNVYGEAAYSRETTDGGISVVSASGGGWEVTSYLPYDLRSISVVHGDQRWPIDRLEAGGSTIARKTIGLSGSGHIYSHPDDPARALIGLEEPLVQLTFLKRLSSQERTELQQRGISLNPADQRLSWLALPVDRLEDCIIVLGFSDSVDAPIQVTDEVTRTSLHMFRQLVCGGAV